MFILWQLQPTTQKFTKFINVQKPADLQIILSPSRSSRLMVTAIANSGVDALDNSEYAVETAQTKCTYSKNITVYMDAFVEVTKRYFGEQYQGFIDSSHKCDPLPRGGRCSFNHNTRSDAIYILLWRLH